ncbi:MAG: response regulator [Planctomycetota bacterium]|nr:response regulator [Planctomycetota bacterium]
MSQSYPTKAQLGLTVLLVEDTPATQRLVLHILKRLGCETILAGHGRAAVEQYTREIGSVDLILMDMNMPVMNGFEATRRLRELGVVQPIVALTAMDDEMRDRCLKAGCDQCLAKPIDREKLYDLLVKVQRGILE